MKKKLEKLVNQSYIDGQLNEEIVKIIAGKLSRQELKQYITLLKQEENKKQVFVTSAMELDKEKQKKLENLFSSKRVVYTVDPSMISGIRVVENDVEYEINLDGVFRDIIQFLSKND